MGHHNVFEQVTRRQALLRGSAAGAGVVAAKELLSPSSAAAVPPPPAPRPPSGPSFPDYVIVNNGGTAEAVNAATGAVDFSGRGDHAPVFQHAINALKYPTGKGGTVAFRGHFDFASQVVVPSSIALVGPGVTADTDARHAAVLRTTYAGSAILVTDQAPSQQFVTLRDFALIGSNQAGQNGIEWNSSAGWVPQDTFVDRVAVFNVGQDGYVLGGGSGSNLGKVWMDHCYCENAGRHGINHGSQYMWLRAECLYFTLNPNGYDYYGSAAELLMLRDSFMLGSQGLVLSTPVNGNTLVGNFVTGTQQAVFVPAGFGSQVLEANYFYRSGGGSVPTVQIDGQQRVVIVGNRFVDTRTAPDNVNHHLLLADTGALSEGIVEANSFYGSQGDAISGKSPLGPVIIGRNGGYTGRVGQITNPFGSGEIGPFGTSPSPTASTSYTVEGTSLMLSVTGGTAVSATIADPVGNTVQSGLDTYSGILPVGYSINFGAFSSAPSVYAGIV